MKLLAAWVDEEHNRFHSAFHTASATREITISMLQIHFFFFAVCPHSSFLPFCDDTHCSSGAKFISWIEEKRLPLSPTHHKMP